VGDECEEEYARDHSGMDQTHPPGRGGDCLGRCHVRWVVSLPNAGWEGRRGDFMDTSPRAREPALQQVAASKG